MKNFFLLPAILLMLPVVLAAQQKTDPGFPANFEAKRALFLQASGGRVMVASHRATHNDVPENSLAAFRASIELGVDIIETDIRATKDGVLVLLHDKTVDRTTNGKGRVDSLSFDEIRKLRLKHNGTLTNEQVPTFEEALKLTRNKILVDLDIKADDKVQEIMAMVKKMKAERSVIFFCYEPKEIEMARQFDPNALVLARSYKPADIPPFFDGPQKANAIHIDEKQQDPALIEQIKQRGGRVWINALGEVDRQVAAGHPEAFETLLQSGVNIIQTDYPKQLIAWLKQRKG